MTINGLDTNTEDDNQPITLSDSSSSQDSINSSSAELPLHVMIKRVLHSSVSSPSLSSFSSSSSDDTNIHVNCLLSLLFFLRSVSTIMRREYKSQLTNSSSSSSSVNSQHFSHFYLLPLIQLLLPSLSFSFSEEIFIVPNNSRIAGYVDALFILTNIVRSTDDIRILKACSFIMFHSLFTVTYHSPALFFVYSFSTTACYENAWINYHHLQNGLHIDCCVEAIL